MKCAKRFVYAKLHSEMRAGSPSSCTPSTQRDCDWWWIRSCIVIIACKLPSGLRQWNLDDFDAAHSSILNVWRVLTRGLSRVRRPLNCEFDWSEYVQKIIINLYLIFTAYYRFVYPVFKNGRISLFPVYRDVRNDMLMCPSDACDRTSVCRWYIAGSTIPILNGKFRSA